MSHSKSTSGVKKSLKALAQLLRHDEQVEVFSRATLGMSDLESQAYEGLGDPRARNMRSGALVLTTRRLLYVVKSRLIETEIEVPLHTIDLVVWEGRMVLGDLNVSARNTAHRFTGYKKELVPLGRRLKAMTDDTGAAPAAYGVHSSPSARLHPDQAPFVQAPPPAAPAPAWYPDPEHPHYQRWWDGHGWTEHRR